MRKLKVFEDAQDFFGISVCTETAKDEICWWKTKKHVFLLTEGRLTFMELT